MQQKGRGMDMTARDIQDGMQVSSSGGEPLGRVARVVWGPAGDQLIGTANSGGVPADQVENIDVFDQTGQGTMDGAPRTSEISYFEVERGGIPGLGGSHLYILIDAVQQVDAGDNRIILACTAREAEERYQHQPSEKQ